MERFKGELITFPTKDSLKTCGFLMDASGKDVLIFIHGMGGHFYKDGFMHGAQELISQGISFFSFNTRGAEIVKDFKDLDGMHHTLGTAFENFEKSTEDISASLDLLEDIGYSRFHLLGHSTGCQKILYYIHITGDSRIKSLIHLSPAEDYEIWKNLLGDDFEHFVDIAREMVERGEGDKLMIPLYEKTGDLWSARRFLSFASRETPEGRAFNYASLDMFSSVTLPTAVFFGDADPYLIHPPEYYAEKLKSAYGGEMIEVHIIENGDHSFHGLEEEIFHRIVDFIGRI